MIGRGLRAGPAGVLQSVDTVHGWSGMPIIRILVTEEQHVRRKEDTENKRHQEVTVYNLSTETAHQGWNEC